MGINNCSFLFFTKDTLLKVMLLVIIDIGNVENTNCTHLKKKHCILQQDANKIELEMILCKHLVVHPNFFQVLTFYSLTVISF